MSATASPEAANGATPPPQGLSASTSPVDSKTARPEPALTKREAIFRLMNEQPLSPWKLADLRRTLIERQWIGDDKKSKHAFDVALSKLYKRGVIDRIGPATYKLASANGSTESR